MAAFSTRGAVDAYARKQGYINPDEEKALSHLTGNGQVLDLGCGTGRTTTLLAERGFTVTGIDISEPMIRKARELRPWLRFQVGDASKLDYPPRSFDHVVFSFNGLDCLSTEDRARCLSEAARVLKPGGLFVYSSHNRLWTLLPTRRRLARVRHLKDNRFTERTVYGLLNLAYVTPREAEQEQRDAGLKPLARYGGALAPWIYYVAGKPRT